MNTTIANLTEKEIIKYLSKNLPSYSKAVNIGIGDDAAILNIPSTKLVVTTDIMTEDKDFRLSWVGASGFDNGFKAFVQNAADIYSMGAKPIAMLLNLSLPINTTLEYLKAFTNGISKAADFYKCKDFSVIGGDLSSSEKISISITMFGELYSKNPLTRFGAKPNNCIALAGIPGLAALGLDILDNKILFDKFYSSSFTKYQLQPKPPLLLAKNASMLATSMTDTSDGLIKDIYKISHASNIAVDIQYANFSKFIYYFKYLTRFCKAKLTNKEIMNYILFGAEDYNLLGTFPKGKVPKRFNVIGSIKKGDDVYIDGKLLEEKGWEHFIS